MTGPHQPPPPFVRYARPPPTTTRAPHTHTCLSPQTRTAFTELLPALNLDNVNMLLYDVRLPLILSFLMSPGITKLSDITDGHAIHTLNPGGYTLNAAIRCGMVGVNHTCDHQVCGSGSYTIHTTSNCGI